MRTGYDVRKLEAAKSIGADTEFAVQHHQHIRGAAFVGVALAIAITIQKDTAFNSARAAAGQTAERN